ncbi:argininosuccinate synthase [Candidatus Vidania fulgoroideae]|uniref:Argininosuccinate synthase n=1 Tax=Candidatus Vidania fulgoroideorum TaxID=881286 RepID=A0A974X7U3_9PROT|nr:argininosuccinate synthase [Candidatus Vidania fulgoroideae]
MKIIRNYKAITKLGLAYSGGLDTSTIIKWLSSKNIHISAYYADLGHDSKNRIIEIGNRAINSGAKDFTVIDCKERLCYEGIKAVKSRAFNFITGTNKYYNTTPLGRVVTSIELTKKMISDGISVWCDGSTYKGNDIERFFRYSYLVNSNIDYYKPWLDDSFINKFGGRKQMSVFLKDNYSNVPFSIDSNILGNTYEGNDIENLKFDSTRISFLLSGKISNNPSKIRLIKFKFIRGNIVSINNMIVNNLSLFRILNKLCKTCYIGISDQVEERITGVKSRGIYESPSMHILHNVYDRAITCLYDQEYIANYNSNGYILGSNLYKGKWFDDLSNNIKNIGSQTCNRINGTITIKIINCNIFFIETKLKDTLYNKDLISMEKTKDSYFSGRDRIGQLNIIKNTVNRHRVNMEGRIV